MFEHWAAVLSRRLPCLIIAWLYSHVTVGEIKSDGACGLGRLFLPFRKRGERTGPPSQLVTFAVRLNADGTTLVDESADNTHSILGAGAAFWTISTESQNYSSETSCLGCVYFIFSPFFFLSSSSFFPFLSWRWQNLIISKDKRK